jgi:class 3 adenylate cyclase
VTDEVLKVDEQRARGLVWACDLANSSKYLNDNRKADDLEAFLPRFLWISRVVVGAASGRFVKWIGDGFLSWFDIPLHRSLEEGALNVFFAAWHLTFAVHVSQLGLSPQQKFRIRHGITYEQDGLTMHVPRVGGGDPDFDIIGRSVVLATRLAGVDAKFPCITTQRDLANIAKKGSGLGHYRKRAFDADERLKYFKGERWGTDQIYSSHDSGPKRQRHTPASRRKLARWAGDLLSKVKDTTKDIPDSRTRFALAYHDFMENGPEWCQQVWHEQRKTMLEMVQLVERLRPLLTKIDGEVSLAEHGKATGANPTGSHN